MIGNKTCLCIACVVAFHAAAAAAFGPGQLREAKVGDKMEPFSLPDLEGKAFSYPREKERVLALVFVAAHQLRSERAMADLTRISQEMERGGRPFDVVAVASGSEDMDYFAALCRGSGFRSPVLVDREDHLWGRLGITAAPTTVVVDGYGRISWIRAGHSFDFGEEAHSGIAQALGLETKPESHGQVKTLNNDAPEDRARRHVKAAQLLESEGRVDEAIEEVDKAEALTPKATEVQLERGRLFCQAGRAQDALKALEGMRTTSRADEAEAKVLSGWAHRQLGDPDLAEKLLTESLRVNPQSVRALYELGKIYRERGEKEKALDAYERALAARFQEAASSGVREGGT